MKYSSLFIALFFGIPLGVCYAETHTGEIKDAEFVIEKQKKNTVNQAQRLFFKASTRIKKSINKPLESTQALRLEAISFQPAVLPYFPFLLAKQQEPFLFNHYCKLGISSLLFPYLEVSLANYTFGKAIWSTQLAFFPELWNKKSKEASICVQGRYGTRSWLFHPKLQYQHAWHKHSHRTPHSCSFHQAKLGLFVQQASESGTQDGQILLNLLKEDHKKLNEQLLTVQYQWIKQFNNWSLRVASYNDIANYINDAKEQIRFILSARPNLYLNLLKSIQLKIALRVAYHNDPIPGKIPYFDLYPMVKITYTSSSKFIPYVGIQGLGVGGSIVPLHLHHVVAKTPFIASNVKLSHYHQYHNLYGGTKGFITPNLSYHLRAAYRKFKNCSRIVSLRNDEISLVYHLDDYNVLKATGIIDYAIPGTTLHGTIQGSYYRYSDNPSAPTSWYHKPTYKLKPRLTYKPHPKVLLTSNLHLNSSITVKDVAGNAIKIDKMINLSLGIDYFISQRFLAFLMVSNLLNRKYIGYTRYPDKKINITGGLQYRW